MNIYSVFKCYNGSLTTFFNLAVCASHWRSSLRLQSSTWESSLVNCTWLPLVSWLTPFWWLLLDKPAVHNGETEPWGSQAAAENTGSEVGLWEVEDICSPLQPLLCCGPLPAIQTSLGWKIAAQISQHSDNRDRVTQNLWNIGKTW